MNQHEFSPNVLELVEIIENIELQVKHKDTLLGKRSCQHIYDVPIECGRLTQKGSKYCSEHHEQHFVSPSLQKNPKVQLVDLSDSDEEDNQLVDFSDSDEEDNQLVDLSDSDEEDNRVEYFSYNPTVLNKSYIPFKDKVKIQQTPTKWTYSEDLWIQFAKLLVHFYFNMYELYRDSNNEEKIKKLEDEYGFKLPSKSKYHDSSETEDRDKLHQCIAIIDNQYIAKIEHLIEIEDMSDIEIAKQLEFRHKSTEGTYEEKKLRLQASNPEFADMSAKEFLQISQKFKIKTLM